MRLSGFDEALAELRSQDFVYGGYSAGVCVLAPTLHGIQQVDDPTVRPYATGSVIWEGLGFLDYLVLPHYKSNHPESAAIDRDVDYCLKNGIAFRTLRDGEVIIIGRDWVLQAGADLRLRPGSSRLPARGARFRAGRCGG
jgi:dipeptidase E